LLCVCRLHILGGTEEARVVEAVAVHGDKSGTRGEKRRSIRATIGHHR
jgi:hypothetical protein